MKPHLPNDKELVANAGTILPQLNEFADLGQKVFQFTPAATVLDKVCGLLFGMGTWYQRQAQFVQACRYFYQTEEMAHRLGSGWGIAAHESIRDLTRAQKIPRSDYAGGISSSIDSAQRLITEFVAEWKSD